jgi:hypothetical protein
MAEEVELLALVLACQFLGLLVADAEVQLVLVLAFAEVDAEAEA